MTTTTNPLTHDRGRGPAPSTRQLLARTRRTIAILAQTQPSLAQLPTAVPDACAKALAAERLDSYRRTGRSYIWAATYEFAWSYFPLTARFTAPDLRAACAALHVSREPAMAAIADLQRVFSPNDPRLAWTLPKGALVLDELALNYTAGGALDDYLRPRLRADLAIGHYLAQRTGRMFAGVRVLPVRRDRTEALFVHSAPRAEEFTAVALDDSDLAPGGTVMPAGLLR